MINEEKSENEKTEMTFRDQFAREDGHPLGWAEQGSKCDLCEHVIADREWRLYPTNCSNCWMRSVRRNAKYPFEQNNVENILLSKHLHHCLATMLAKLCLGSSQWQMNGQQMYHYPLWNVAVNCLAGALWAPRLIVS